MKAIRIKQRALLIATAIISIILVCCAKADTDIQPLPANSADDAGWLTIMQSKLFFENFTAKRNAKTKAADKYLNRLVVGNFVPNWDNAVASNDGIIGSVDVPIESQMKYVALRQYREDNITFVSRTSLYQKLIFVKNDTLNSIFPYLLSLIPDKDFDDNHQGEDIAGNFINLGDKGGFSGLAIYTTPYTGYLIRASRFENGIYIDGAFVLDPHHPFEENALKAESFLKDIKIMRVVSIATKGHEDVVDGGQLDEVVVTAERPKKDDDKEEEQESDDDVDKRTEREEENRGKTDPGGGGGGGSSHGNGETSNTEDNENLLDNEEEEEEEPQDLYTVTIAEPVGGSATGGGGYKKGSTATISAIPDEGYVFAGWSGDYSGLDNPATFTVEDDMTIYAKFYEESSECGRLVKNLESLPYLMRCREKIGSGTGLTEFGYIKTSTSIEEIEGRNNAITLNDLPNTLELAHTHIDVIYPSIGDLRSIYRRYYKGCISDYENFKYIIVSPEYFVVIKIEDTNRMDVLIRDSLIIKKVITDDNKYSYEFSKEIEKNYDRFIPIQSNSVEGHFSNFMDFFEYLNPGLSISVYKTDTESGEMTYKKVSNREDFSNLLNRVGICNN